MTTRPITLQCHKCKKQRKSADFYMRKGKIDQTWCKQCYKRWHRERYTPKSNATDEQRSCKFCGKFYTPKQRRPSVFCSRVCKGNARNEQSKLNLLNLKNDRYCPGCGKLIRKIFRADKKWCSEECASKVRGHTMNVTRRIRTNEPIGDFSRLDIYRRDDWVCQICKKPVDKTLSFPDPYCASLDHIVPLSRGGTHESRNVQLTHLSCNTSKGNRSGDVYRRPALLYRGKRIYTLPEAAAITGSSLAVLQRAVVLGRVRCEPRKKFDSRYLSEEVIEEINRDGIPGSRKWRRQKKIERGPRTRDVKCKNCGQIKVVEVSLNSPRSFCSDECYKDYRNKGKRLDPKRLSRICCSVCGQKIKGRTQVKRVNLCSKKCVNAHRRSKKVIVRTKICSVCNRTFDLPKKQGHPPATCSYACAKKWPSMKSRAWYTENKAKRRLQKSAGLGKGRAVE